MYVCTSHCILAQTNTELLNKVLGVGGFTQQQQQFYLHVAIVGSLVPAEQDAEVGLTVAAAGAAAAAATSGVTITADTETSAKSEFNRLLLLDETFIVTRAVGAVIAAAHDRSTTVHYNTASRPCSVSSSVNNRSLCVLQV